MSECVFWLSPLQANYNSANLDHDFDALVEPGWYYSESPYSIPDGPFALEEDARVLAADPDGCQEIDPLTGRPRSEGSEGCQGIDLMTGEDV